MKLVEVQEALSLISQYSFDYGNEGVQLLSATGRIIAEELNADRPLPPYNRVTMDGISIDYSQIEKGILNFPIEDISAAGNPIKILKNKSNCIEVMTGSVLPENTDTVIRYEDLEIANENATIIVDKVKKGQNIHYTGSDMPSNEQLLQPGDVLHAANIGIAASIGKSVISVRKNPKTCIISTGDELVDIKQIPLAHQIRKSNVFAINSFLKRYNIEAELFHLDDDLPKIEQHLEEVLNEFDLIILSGGVSKGKFDFIPNALINLGVEKQFHGVKQRPGKPLFFGQKSNTAVFGLPGNPVSSIICARIYVSHWINHCLQIKPKLHFAELAEDFVFKPDLHRFLPVKLASSPYGISKAFPIKGNGSGDFISLRNADGILELPRGKERFTKGSVFTLHLLVQHF